MVDMLMVLFLTPMYYIGYMGGFGWRSMYAGYYDGFNLVQMRAEQRLIREVQKFRDDKGLDPLDFNTEGEME